MSLLSLEAHTVTWLRVLLYKHSFPSQGPRSPWDGVTSSPFLADLAFLMFTFRDTILLSVNDLLGTEQDI